MRAASLRLRGWSLDRFMDRSWRIASHVFSAGLRRGASCQRVATLFQYMFRVHLQHVAFACDPPTLLRHNRTGRQLAGPQDVAYPLKNYVAIKLIVSSSPLYKVHNHKLKCSLKLNYNEVYKLH